MEYLGYEVFDLVTVYQLLIIVHLIGLALGAGAALFSDFLFTSIIKDKKINPTEYDHLKLASRVIWLGLSILIISGALIFIGDSERLIESDKFLAKMTIVLVLTINGVLFHFVQLPRLKKVVNKDLTKNKRFRDVDSVPFFVGGAVSGVSWVAALVLGALNSIDLSYTQIMVTYVVVVIISAIVALRIRKKILL